MIAYLKGTIKAKHGKLLVIDVHDVGYGVFVPTSTAYHLVVGAGVELYIHTNVREDALELYGLPNAEAMELFKQLISISGVGPKMALAVFDVGELSAIKRAIGAGDAGFLTKVSGIGKKTAEMIIIKLRDKADWGTTDSGSSEVLDALVALGYPLADAREVLAQIPTDVTDTEGRIRTALQKLSRRV